MKENVHRLSNEDDLIKRAVEIDRSTLSPEQKKELNMALLDLLRSRERLKPKKKKSKLEEIFVPLMITISIFAFIGILLIIR